MYEYRATVDRVVDGDTIDFTIDLGFDIKIKERCRLYGVDTPEVRTRNKAEKKRGLAAKARVLELLPEGSKCIIQTRYDRRGKYGRVLFDAELEIPELNGHILSQVLLQERHAKPSP